MIVETGGAFQIFDMKFVFMLQMMKQIIILTQLDPGRSHAYFSQGCVNLTQSPLIRS